MKAGVLLAVVLAAHAAPAAPAAPSGSGAAPRVSTRRLEAAAIAAVRRDQQVAVAALWEDRVPPSAARILVGSALAALAVAAAQRRAEGIRVRMLRSALRIISVRLARGGDAAEVIARWSQRLRPARLDGTSAGRPISLDEEAALFLRRAPRSGRFVVSRVELR